MSVATTSRRLRTDNAAPRSQFRRGFKFFEDFFRQLGRLVRRRAQAVIVASMRARKAGVTFGSIPNHAFQAGRA